MGMKLVMLMQLIEAASPAQLNELALWYFRGRGYEPVVRDGTGDGSIDLRLFQMGGVRRVAVQATTQRKGLYTKLQRDASQAKALGVDQLWLVSSRRLPEAKFIEQADKIFSRTGVHLTRADAQSLASHAFNRSEIDVVLRTLDIEVAARSPHPPRRPDLREDLACSYAFFGVDPDHFRQSILDRAVTGVVAAEGASIEADIALHQAAQLLGLDPSHRSQLVSALDRLRQRGILVGNGKIDTAPAVRRDWQAMRAAGEESRARLIGDIEAVLSPHLEPRDVAAMVDLVLNTIAAFVSSSGQAVASRNAGVVSDAPDAQTPGGRTMSQLRRLRNGLALAGVDPVAIDALLREVAEIAEASAWARTLAAGDLYLHLATLTREGLARALTGGRELEIIVDPSVTMPMLCVHEHGIVRHRFFQGAAQILSQAERWQSRLLLPLVYLEEMAAHLIEAWDDYSGLVDEELELRGSTNSFVAHFVSLRAEGMLHPSLDFDAYVASFGLVRALRSGDFHARRSAVMQRLQTSLDRLGIKVVEPLTRPDSRRLVEENVAYLQSTPRTNRLERDRPRILVDHDVQVLAWLESQPLSATRARVFCTWDRTIFRYFELAEPSWDAFDPLTLGDSLALMHPESDAVPASIGAIASELGMEDVEVAARIWDTLAQIEKGGFADAVLRKQAREFKTAFLQRRRRLASVRSIQDEWAAWKEGRATYE